jgi:hypothetical protein
MIPRLVHTIRGPKVGTGASSDHGSALRIGCGPRRHDAAARAPLLRRRDPNLHLLLRPLQQRFDAGARGHAAGRYPGVPRLVHVVHGVDVGEPDGGAQELGLVGAGLAK